MNPAAHLTFTDEVAQPLTPEGRVSIAAYALNRVALLAVRRDRLRHLRNEELLARLFEIDPPLVDIRRLIQAYGSEELLSLHIAEARKARQQAALNAAEFAGMVRANFPHLPTG